MCGCLQVPIEGLPKRRHFDVDPCDPVRRQIEFSSFASCPAALRFRDAEDPLSPVSPRLAFLGRIFPHPISPSPHFPSRINLL